MSRSIAEDGFPDTQQVSGSVNVGNWPANQPVSLAVAPDIADRTGRLLGHVIVDSMPAGGAGLTDAELRATAVPVSGQFWQATQPVSGPVTDAQLRTTPVPVSGTFWPGTQPVSAAALPLPAGASTEATLALIKAKTDNIDVLLSSRTKPADTQPVSGTFWQGTQPVSGTFWQATQPVSGPLTDAQLRASAVPVSGPLTDAQLRASAVPVSGTLTDAQLRATAVPVSGFPAWPYPATVTPVAAHSAVSANAVASATLAAAASKFTYLTSVQIFATGATAAGAQNATITGLLGGTMTIPFAVPAGVNLGAVPINLSFAIPLRSSAVNTALVVSLPALGAGNTRATVNAQGFQQ